MGCTVPTQLDIGYHGEDKYYAAADNWNQTCGVQLINVHKGEGDIYLEGRNGISGNAWGQTTLERPVLGTVGPRKATHIWFLQNDWAVAVLTHEFGHALGLGHSSTGIMKPGDMMHQLDPSKYNSNILNILPGLITPADCAFVIGKEGEGK